MNGGCPIPIRKGIYATDGFGWDHINYRREVDGQINHENNAYARNLWRHALGRAGALKANPRSFCHHVHYTTPDDKKRTMVVGVSDTNYQGDKGLKGILTAFWVSGHTDPCT